MLKIHSLKRDSLNYISTMRINYDAKFETVFLTVNVQRLKFKKKLIVTIPRNKFKVILIVYKMIVNKIYLKYSNFIVAIDFLESFHYF